MRTFTWIGIVLWFGWLSGCVQNHPKAAWVRAAVVQQINLRTFPTAKNFRELESHLPELQSHGITVLDLMPMFPIGTLNRTGKLGNLSSIRDYYDVNDEFGSLADLQSLIRTAHQTGMKVIVDIVPAYTSWDCTLLLEHPDWYRHNADEYIVAPNETWNDVAALNLYHHELRKYMIAVMKYWLTSVDLDGYRILEARMLPCDFLEIAHDQIESVKPVLFAADSVVASRTAFDTSFAVTSFTR